MSIYYFPGIEFTIAIKPGFKRRNSSAMIFGCLWALVLTALFSGSAHNNIAAGKNCSHLI
jgi:hypothetical protein